jgi:hypothetical protein
MIVTHDYARPWLLQCRPAQVVPADGVTSTISGNTARPPTAARHRDAMACRLAMPSNTARDQKSGDDVNGAEVKAVGSSYVCRRPSLLPDALGDLPRPVTR